MSDNYNTAGNDIIILPEFVKLFISSKLLYIN